MHAVCIYVHTVIFVMQESYFATFCYCMLVYVERSGI